MQPVFLAHLGARGFKFRGPGEYALLGVVSCAGDVNGDGIDDFIVAGNANDAVNQGSGNSYVLYGRADGAFGGINLASLSASQGFRIHGNANTAGSGLATASAGDFNGDGYDDIIIGGVNNSSGACGAWLVFGGPSGSTTELGLLTPAQGFFIQGGLNDATGLSVSSAGDINKDGFDDIIVGSPDDSSGGSFAGQAHVIFGKASGFGTVNLATLSPSDGFVIRGNAQSEFVGSDVTGLGDINGDGIDDLAVSAPFADENGFDTGAVYVIYGRTGGFGTIDLATLGGADGAIIRGINRIGASIAGAGDVNGDGYEDIIIGAPENDGSRGRAFVVFGKAGGIGSVDVNAMGPNDGFAIHGSQFDQLAGFTVAAAGDVDGDGFDDIMVGVPFDPNTHGSAYVILGKAGGFGTINLLDLKGIDTPAGFSIFGEQFGDAAGRTLSSAGDVNDDGVADILIGSRDNGAGGFAAGASYLILGLLPTAAVIRMGTAGGQTLTGGHFDDQLHGLGGNDLLIGNGGIDLLEGGAGDDVLRGGADNDTLDGGEGDDLLRGEAGADIVHGGGGNDTALVVGGTSSADTDLDSVSLGSGIDHLDVDYSRITQAISFAIPSFGVNGAAGIVRMGGSDRLYYSDIERLTITTGSADDVVYGASGNDDISTGSGNDTLDGGSGDDVLNGGPGVDWLVGGAGADVYLVDDAADVVVELDGEGADHVHASASYALGANASVESLSASDVSSLVSLSLTGNSFANTIRGNAGANVLNGGGGADTLVGLGGNDVYFVGDAGTVIVEGVGEGTDRVFASVSYALTAGAHVEILSTDFHAGTAAINLSGNELGNLIYGNAGNNVLDGKSGIDTLVGFGGDDFYFVDHAGDYVVEGASEGTGDRIFASMSYTLAPGSYIEILSTDFHAGTAAISLSGNELANLIFGNAGSNLLDGRGGIDTLVGFGGDDFYFVDHAGDYVVEGASEGTGDRIFASASYTLAPGSYIEILSTDFHAGTAAISLSGNELNNLIFGNAGNNVLNGRGGIDTLVGFGGEDFYFVDHAGDYIVEGATEGTADRVFASVSYTLAPGSYIEILSTDFHGGTAAIDLSGNELANLIYGNAGSNVLDGRGGSDTLIGFGGDDFYFVDNAGDVVVEGASEGTGDRVFASTSYTLAGGSHIEILSTDFHGGTAAIELRGNEIANLLYGNAGANVLDGKGGSDALFGFGGVDTFAFTTALGAGNVDTIFDFDADDTIALDDAVFAGLGLGALNATAFTTGPAATTAEHRIVYDQATGNLFYDADGNGVGAAVLFATLQAAPALTASDFTVI